MGGPSKAYDLDADGLKDSTAKSAIGLSTNYYKTGSVPTGSGYSPTNRLGPTPVIFFPQRRALTTNMKIDGFTRYGTDWNAVEFSFYGLADNPIVTPSAVIDWDFKIAVSVNTTTVLEPKWFLFGESARRVPCI